MSKTVVITGATAGVGRACVREFAEHGYGVGLLGRNERGLAAAEAEVTERGGQAVGIRTDMADAAAVERAATIVEDTLGPIDVWVNNAMVSVFAPFMTMSDEEFRRVVDVTFLGYVRGTRVALERMRPRNRGSIVQVGSALAHRGIPLQSAYCASKHAVQGFCDSLRAELIHDRSRINVTMVQLPAINTPQFDIQRNKMAHKAQPVPPMFQPEVAARAVRYAAEHRRREIWVGLPSVRAILGNRLLPGALDRHLGAHGYESQQRAEPADPDAPDVLFAPLDHDLGAHGSFDEQAHPRSPQTDLNLFPPYALVRDVGGRWVDRLAAAALGRVLR